MNLPTSQADGHVDVTSPQSKEFVVLVGDNMSIESVRKEIEESGYEVADTLDCLRCIIVKIQQDQIKTLNTPGSTWNKIIKKLPIESFD